MAINEKILNKVCEKVENDVDLRVFITEILNVEAERKAHYKERYRDLIMHFATEKESNENGDENENK